MVCVGSGVGVGWGMRERREERKKRDGRKRDFFGVRGNLTG